MSSYKGPFTKDTLKLNTWYLVAGQGPMKPLYICEERNRGGSYTVGCKSAWTGLSFFASVDQFVEELSLFMLETFNASLDGRYQVMKCYQEIKEILTEREAQ